MATYFTTQTRSRDVEWFNLQFESNRYSLSSWQRDDCWPHEYQKTLINSILHGIDIPKIYIGHIANTNVETIMDGGHRTRAINEFINNKFAIKLNGQDVFFDRVIDQTTRGTRNLTADEKRIFLSYELTVTTYINITENNCRMIFNILQNAQPMSVADVINSHQSDLVDYLRIVSKEFMVEGEPLKEWVVRKKILKNADNSELLYQLASWWTIIYPILDGDDDIEEEVAMRYLEKGLTRESKCLKYVKKYTIGITNDMKSHFEEYITYIAHYPNISKMTSTDINTLLHSKKWIAGFSEENFNIFLDAVSEFTTIKNRSNKKFKEGYIEEGTELLEQANEMDDEYNGDLNIWKNSKSSGGSNFSGMSRRKNIVEEHCLE